MLFVKSGLAYIACFFPHIQNVAKIDSTWKNELKPSLIISNARHYTFRLLNFRKREVGRWYHNIRYHNKIEKNSKSPILYRKNIQHLQ